MTLTEQQKKTAVLAGCVIVGLFLLYSIVFGPLLSWQTRLDREHNSVSNQTASANRRITEGDSVRDRLKKIGVQQDQSKANNLVMRTMSNWMEKAGIEHQETGRSSRGSSASTAATGSIKATSTSPEENGFQKLSFHIIVANGRMSQISEFLQRFQNPGFPAQVLDVKLSTSGDGKEDKLRLEMDIVTICLAAPGSRTSRGGAAPR